MSLASVTSFFSREVRSSGRAFMHRPTTAARKTTDSTAVLLEKAAVRGQDFLPETSENQNRNLSGLFFRYFADSVTGQMRRILESGKYIPQEIINITDFC